MKILIFRVTIISVFISLFIFFIGQQQVQAQQDKPLNLDDTLSKLTFTSRIKTSTEEINRQLITDVRKRKVNFTLTRENKDSLKKAGGNDF